MAISDLGAGRYLVTDGARQRLAYAVAAGQGRTWVFLDGRVHLVAKASAVPPARSEARDDASALMAPMPATVTRVNVAPGDAVSRGDVLIVLEAMKMELPLTAPRDGTVHAIACRPGDLVRPGVVLVELES